MATIKRMASSQWSGSLQEGKGTFSSKSGYFKDLPLSFASRFESGEGTNPEELIGAAHAGCFNMVVADKLAARGNAPKKLETRATVTLREEGGGFAIAAVHLELRGDVPGVDESTFRQIAEEAKNGCPVSQLLQPGLDELSVEASLNR